MKKLAVIIFMCFIIFPVAIFAMGETDVEIEDTYIDYSKISWDASPYEMTKVINGIYNDRNVEGRDPRDIEITSSDDVIIDVSNHEDLKASRLYGTVLSSGAVVFRDDEVVRIVLKIDYTDDYGYAFDSDDKDDIDKFIAKYVELGLTYMEDGFSLDPGHDPNKGFALFENKHIVIMTDSSEVQAFHMHSGWMKTVPNYSITILLTNPKYTFDEINQYVDDYFSSKQ